MDLSKELLTLVEKLLRNPEEAKAEIIELEKSNHELAEAIGNLDDILHNNFIQRNLFEASISKVNNQLLQYALQNYGISLTITDEDNLLDSLITSINMLGDELSYSTMTSHYLLDIFNSYPDVVIILDEVGVIQNVNKIATDFFQTSKKDLIKTNFTELLSENIEFADFMDNIKKNQTTSITKADKSTIQMQLRFSPLIRKNNHKAGMVFILY